MSDAVSIKATKAVIAATPPQIAANFGSCPSSSPQMQAEIFKDDHAENIIAEVFDMFHGFKNLYYNYTVFIYRFHF